MKKSIIVMAALAALVSCNKVERTSMPLGNGTLEVVVNATSEECGGKAYMADLNDNKYPVYWNDIENASIDEFSNGTKLQEVYSDSFEKDSQDATKGRFSFTMAVKDSESFDYYVIIPGKSSVKDAPNPTHGWRGCKTGNISYLINHTVDQTPLADRPDPTTHVMVASSKGHKTQQTSFNLEFKHVVSYGKMTITNFPALAQGETVSRITITTPAGKYMSGRYYENIETGVREPYNANNIKNYITINPENITFNTTGFDVWFTCHTLELEKGDLLSVKVETSVKTYEGNLKISKNLSFKAGVVSSFTYNWTKSQPQAETRTLTFDFSTCPTGWPSGKDEYTRTGDEGHQEEAHIYTLGDEDYEFTTAPCKAIATTSPRGVAWGYDGTNPQNYLVIQAQRFFGLPKLEGWKLIQVKFVQATSTNTSRKLGITAEVSAQNGQKYVEGGGVIFVGTNGTEYTFNLTESEANKRYYMAPTAKASAFATLTLVYEKVEK